MYYATDRTASETPVIFLFWYVEICLPVAYHCILYTRYTYACPYLFDRLTGQRFVAPFFLFFLLRPAPLLLAAPFVEPSGTSRACCVLLSILYSTLCVLCLRIILFLPVVFFVVLPLREILYV